MTISYDLEPENDTNNQYPLDDILDEFYLYVSNFLESENNSKTTKHKLELAGELESLKKIQHLTAYIEHRQADIDKYNTNNGIDKSVIVNGRNLTNLGLFRKYINQYILSHPGINKEMHLMVRHLQPTEKGIPLEIYCFSKDKTWLNYEHIMADIFDHIMASVSHFDLEIFETISTSNDLK